MISRASIPQATRLLVGALVVAGCAATVEQQTSPEATASASATAPVASDAPSAAASASAPSAAASATPSAAPSATAMEQPAPGSPGALLMRDHFKQTATIRDAVIWNNPGKAVSPAEGLANLDGVSSLPKHWQVSVTNLTDAARRIRQSSDLTEVAAATADIGRACGLCHTAAKGPSVHFDPAPSAEGSVTARMHRHKWATERLWEGLYVPSQSSWTAGAEALALDPFTGDTLKKGGVHARSAASRFAAVTKKLAAAKTNEDRGATYAELLSTCGPCHEAMGLAKR